MKYQLPLILSLLNSSQILCQFAIIRDTDTKETKIGEGFKCYSDNVGIAASISAAKGIEVQFFMTKNCTGHWTRKAWESVVFDKPIKFNSIKLEKTEEGAESVDGETYEDDSKSIKKASTTKEDFTSDIDEVSTKETKHSATKSPHKKSKKKGTNKKAKSKTKTNEDKKNGGGKAKGPINYEGEDDGIKNESENGFEAWEEYKSEEGEDSGNGTGNIEGSMSDWGKEDEDATGSNSDSEKEDGKENENADGGSSEHAKEDESEGANNDKKPSM